MSTAVSFTLDGETAEARPGETILEAARRLGRDIPTRCHSDAAGYRRDANCRACVVEVEGERVLAPSCRRVVDQGMSVRIDSPRAEAARKGVLDLLADRPLAEAVDDSHPAIRFDPDHCILCGLCVRACREVQGHGVIAIEGRGPKARIVFDHGLPMGESSCVGCGECVQACPTPALMPKEAAETGATAAIDTLCPYCGVGCQTRVHLKDGAVDRVEGRDGPANRGRLCIKGRFGWDYATHPQRLDRPLIRRDGAPKEMMDPATPYTHFREASWDEALERAAEGFLAIRDGHGPGALGGLGSAKGSNEEAYLFQKLIRTGFGTNNVDHCARLCHAASVAALMETIGSGAVTAPFTDCLRSDLIVVIGANPPVNHPVAATFVRNAVEKGAKLVVVDPREQALDRFATLALHPRPGTDVPLLNAVMNVIVAEGLTDQAFIRERTRGFEAFAEHLRDYTPEAMAGRCGLDAGAIRAFARLVGKAERAIFFWGMGITQHVHGTNNARCLSALALMTGQVGRPGTGLHPLRGQNNVQGTSDMGVLPPFLPGYARVDDEGARARFEKAWGAALDPVPGRTVVEMIHGALEGALRGMLIMGENPSMSDPDTQRVRRALASLEHLVVQDIFLTETAMFADVVLPATSKFEKLGSFTNTNRQVQLARPALPAPGAAREDWDILVDLGRRLGLPWTYGGVDAVWEEMRATWPALAGIPWRRLERDGWAGYPCAAEDEPGTEVLMDRRFNTPDGLGRFVPVDVVSPDELPDRDYPLVLTTGRLLEHWHTGTMTRRAQVLDALEPELEARLAPVDMTRLGIGDGEDVSLETRRGGLTCVARLDPSIPEGVVFIPFCFPDAPANLLTNPVLDPIARIPEYKYCAVRVRPAS